MSTFKPCDFKQGKRCLLLNWGWGMSWSWSRSCLCVIDSFRSSLHYVSTICGQEEHEMFFVLFCSFHLCSCYGITVIRIQSKPSRVICRSCGPWYSECPPSLITRMVVRRQLCVDQWKHRKAGICQTDHACNVEILDPGIENDWGWLTDWKQAKKTID